MAASTRAAKGTKAARKTPAKVVAKKAQPKASSNKKAAGKASTTSKAKKAPAKKAAVKKAPAKASAGKSSATKQAPKKAAAQRASTNRASSRSLSASPTIKKAPPRRKGPLDKFLLGQLEALQEERATYLRQAESLRAEADLLAAEREPGDVQFDEESGEGDTLAVERERDLALSAQASAAVEEIDIAIAKVHEGTYGVCERCNGNIPKERLRALPYAALCVQCKSAGFTRR